MTPSDPLERFLSGPSDAAAPFLLVERDGTFDAAPRLDTRSLAILPGSFNPLHEGHTRLAAVAAELTQREVLFELSVTNVDKPPLAEPEVRRRLAQFSSSPEAVRVVVTRATRFIEKARLFPGATFVVGWDTFARLLDARYYGDTTALHAALAEMQDRGCRFLVAGRIENSAFHTLRPSDVPPEYVGMFEAIPESRFRADISSTALRGD
jgi:nicotinic acid mononucleotide adenylyltransferase